MNIYKQCNEILFNELNDLVIKYPRSYFNMLKTAKFKHLYDWINQCVPQLNDIKFKISTKCNWILNGIVDFPVCEICNAYFGKNLNLQIHTHYSKTCPKCSRKVAAYNTKLTISNKLKNNSNYYQKIIEQRRNTSARLHGDSRWNNSNKNKETCMKKYGVDNIRKTQYCKEKIKETKKNNHGNENYNNIEKHKKTCLMTYGVEWPMQDARIRAKAKSKYSYNNLEFDSKQELCFYIWLKDTNKDFVYRPNISISYEHEGKMHSYIPDFIVEGQIVEIKGDHFFKEDGTMCNPWDHSLDALYEAKHQCMLKNNVKIIRQHECSIFIDYVIQTYGSAFIKSCKRNII